jgi:predicted glycosyltransferase
VRVWIDLANSPHVPLLAPVVERLEADGDLVLLTARDNAQTVELARRRWPDVQLVGGGSPAGKAAKGAAIARRAVDLARAARRWRADVAFSHGSYAQISAARLVGVPGVTMMDYEHQPANHLSFRLARRVIVPDAFPADALDRFGAVPAKVVRYEGFKEELYLAGFTPDPRVLGELELDPRRVIAVFRPPPEGALYHRSANERFDRLLEAALARDDVQVVLLPRTGKQKARYAEMSARILIPETAVDGSSLLALADLTIGGGGTMNRESALLGTPTSTVFAGELAAVDVELIRRGLLHDLRDESREPVFEKKTFDARPALRSDAILETIIRTLREVASPGRALRPRLRRERRPG